MVVLAVAAARRIVARLPELNETASAAAVKACEEALDLVRGASEVVVRANPDDWAALDHLAEEIRRSMQGSRNMRVVEDESIGRGGVVLEGPDCLVDATAASRVDRIADELMADWRKRMTELSLES